MSKIIKTFASIVALFTVFSVSAQKIEFVSNIHDFGTISEAEIPITTAFKFTNTGDKPLVISTVRSSCGCTSPAWTKEPVLPGATGEVKATYTTRSAYPFTKNITVVSNAGSVTLTIKGDVTRKPEDFMVTYPDSIGKLRVKNKRDLNFSQIPSSKTTPAQAINIANATNENIDVVFENVPEYLTVTAIPATLTPKQKGDITISVNGAKAKTFGYKNDKITVKVGNAKEVINVSSIIAQEIEKSEKIPASELEKTFIDLGQLQENKISGALEVKNVGNSDLIINTFSTDNNAFVSGFKKAVVVKPGKTGTVKYSAKNLKKGDNTAQIFLSTNDPRLPLLKYTVKANIL